ncbi:solute carrier family 28 member 3-like isoform X2 [Pectinophora gossypiella]|uniref:solute carrier family 28 member 3-like isoform X2 n=1 Tax=Pectinophora gossypiella TaxID=13191 RepID=UPI00214F01C1|nr:solute carrier family 28 member 3-like isoform X2 [Pectinophora gossypiella]XP_049882685.1 solute carrier family 28 member 3-like isoform X2 [Pectinophora gossypiella]XP_049882686.1 solute carrier family 28 member 3-like isoform X2 [Pectinophora gossypiella]
MDVLYSAESKPMQQNGGEIEMGDVEKRNGEISHENLDYEPSGWLETTLLRAGSSTEDFFKKNSQAMKTVTLFVINGLVIGFFFGCLYYWMTLNNEPLELCHGFGSLIALLSIVYFFIIYFMVVKRYLGKWFETVVWSKVESQFSALWKFAWFRWCLSLVILGALVGFLLWDTWAAPHRLVSLSGLSIILLLGWVFSAHPGRVNWRTVLMALLIQFVFGIIFIRWDTGRVALQCFSDKVATFLSYGIEGAAFTFGDLLVRTEGVFAFSTLPVIFFFSMLVEVLFFWGALQWFVLKLGHLLKSATGTTVCESVICVGNVFLGMTESVLLIKPYLSLLTPSEIHVVMASGFATVSGTILAAYIGFGAEPAHLVTASVMSAPAAVCLSKLLMPETKRSLTTVTNIQPIVSQDQSALSAATRGATNGIALVLNIIANLVAFVSLIAFLNGVLGYSGGLLGFPELSLEWIMGKVFIPLCWLMGVPWEECELVGTLIGLKTIVNEFVAYQRMGEMKKEGLLSPRGELIATYSLCGFTNPSSAGIMIGAIAALAPNQREVLASVALRAFFAGCGICFMTACIAGVLMPEGSFV